VDAIEVASSIEPQAGGLPGLVFSPVVPGNAAIYSHDAFGSIQTANERDVFVVHLDPNQSLAVQVRPFGALVPTITLTGQNGDDITLSDTASGPLRSAVLAPYATTAGEYRITVSGDGNTTGVYQLKILINAGFELEEAGRENNDAPAAAQNLDEAFFSFAGNQAAQAAVIGSAPATRQTIYSANMNTDPGWTLDGGTGSGFWEYGPPGADPNDPAPGFNGANVIGYGLSTVAPPTFFERLYATTPPLDLREAGNIHIEFQGALYARANESSFEVSTIDGDWYPLRDESSSFEDYWQEHSYVLPRDVTTNGETRFRWGIGPTGNLSSGGWTIDELKVTADVPSAADWYRFSLDDGQSASLSVTSHTQQQVFLQLYDATGTTLLVDPTSSQPGTETIDAFRDLTDDGLPTEYLVRVTAINSAYSLVVLRDAQLDAANNTSGDTPQTLWPTTTNTMRVRGYLQSDSISSNNELEPNDDGQFGADINDLPFANDVSSHFAPLGTDNYRAQIRGDLATTSFDDELDVYRFTAAPGDIMVIEMLGLDSGAGTLGDPTLTLVDDTGNVLAFNDDRDATTYESRIVYNSFAQSGNYYVFAQSFFFGDPGSYLLRLTLRSENFATSADWYSFSANTGDTISLTLNVPGDEGDLPENLVQPQLTLLPPGDAPAIRGTDVIDYVVHQPGIHRVRASIDRTSRGSYVLEVNGASPSPTPFSVLDNNLSTPYWQSAPDSITLEFNNAFRLDTFELSDVQINGQAAPSAYLVDAQRLRIDISAEMLVASNTLSISAGALTDIHGVPVDAYLYEFYVDGDRPTVTSISIAENAVLAADFSEITVEFSEPMRLDALGPEDMRLINFNDVAVSPISWEYDTEYSTLTIQYPPLDDSRYELVLRSGTDAFADYVGNTLLGSGNNQQHYTRSFVIDGPAYTLTDAFETLSPAVTLAREQLKLGDISFAGDSDRYDVELVAGQVMSVAVQARSSITATVTITGPNGETIASSQASAPGRSAVISSVRAGSTGVYGIELRDVADAIGGYQIRVGLDLLFEPEEVGGAANNTATFATNLDDVFVHVPGTPIERAMVRGISDFQIEAMIPTSAYWHYYHEIDAPGEDWNAPHFDDSSWRIGQAELGYGDGDESTVLESGELYYNPYVTSYFRYHYPADRDPSRYQAFRINGRHDDGIAIYMNGTELARVALPPDASHSTPGDAVSDNATLLRTITLANLPPATLVAGQNVIAAEVHQYYPSTDLSFRARFDLLMSQPSYQDWYELTLADGESLSLFLEPLTDSPVSLALYGSDGIELLANASLTDTGTLAIDGFTDTTSDNTDDSYLILVTGQSTRYSLAALRDATLDLEPNNTFAQSQSGTKALGTITGDLTGAAALRQDFAGMSSFDTECGCEPPDTHLAVGRDHVIEVVNTAIAVYSKRGEQVVAPTEFSDFFAADVVQGNEFLFDPVVAYDELADRYIVAILTAASSFDDESDLLYAVSNTGDPTQGWD
jgi:hypothetical protein